MVSCLASGQEIGARYPLIFPIKHETILTVFSDMTEGREKKKVVCIIHGHQSKSPLSAKSSIMSYIIGDFQRISTSSAGSPTSPTSEGGVTWL